MFVAMVCIMAHIINTKFTAGVFLSLKILLKEEGSRQMLCLDMTSDMPWSIK